MPVEQKYWILVNEEQQYCQARVGSTVPVGWSVMGDPMGDEESLAMIEKLWTDMRPLSIRKTMLEWDQTQKQIRESMKAAEPVQAAKAAEPIKMMGSSKMQKIAPTPWLQTHGDRPSARIRLFCFPYLGGSADFVKGVQPLLPPDIEVVAIQYPGHGRRMGQTPIDNLKQFLSECSEALLPAIRGCPDYAFFGYSMGCYLCQELAIYLKANYDTWPSKMIMASQNPKFVVCTDPILDRLTDDGIMEQLKSVGGLPDALLEAPELVRMMIPLYRADSKLSEQDESDAHHWEEELSKGNIPLLDTLYFGYAGKGEREINRESLANWSRLSSTHSDFCQVRIFEGGHLFIDESLDLMCRMLAKDLLMKKPVAA
eukprot:TRINITY_DN13056_c0_g1_i1.p1 TRINITY_DN13056_c0_g1~~TRINITY_DN13056_c0_g1_i1.p1  ORF type:complete len:391 (+),score=66.57 TRINITY_DN13056_c0_g1_i1:66-1175(+)